MGTAGHREKTFEDALGSWARLGVLGERSRAFEALLDGALGRALRVLFRPQLEGWERLPEGPFLAVANHSGGGLAEVLVMGLLWQERYGRGRRITALAHPLLFHTPVAAAMVRGLGAVPATYEAALDAFARGVPVLVFPGGVYDAFRPVWRAGEVSFEGHKGFLRLARRAGVPVVPIGIEGSAYTTPILWRSRALAWALGPRLLKVKRYPVTALGAAGAAALWWRARRELGAGWTLGLIWLWLISPVAMFTPVVPWKIRLRVGAALEPEALFGGAGGARAGGDGAEEGAGDEAALEAAYAQVEGAVQALVSALRGRRGDGA